MKVREFIEVANSDICFRYPSEITDVVTISSCYMHLDCLSTKILNSDIDYIDAEQNKFYIYLKENN